MTDSSGTLDITNVVNQLKEAFITWGVDAIFSAEVATPGLTWVGLPVLSTLDRELLRVVLGFLVNSAVMEAFFLNTAIRKSGQAQDFVDAINAKNNLPPTASEAEYAKAEQDQIRAFHDFVVLSQ